VGMVSLDGGRPLISIFRWIANNDGLVEIWVDAFSGAKPGISKSSTE
jgi:hypothetical protein